jgi:DNA repair exonuclease SbcCD ATPase subunit
VALKKPSDFFGNNKKTPLDEVKEEYVAASPEKIEQVSEAFDVFKANLNHIQSLSDFTSTFDSFRENLEKVENVSSEVNTIKDEIKSLIKQEDLDSAMMAQLLFVEESISKIESKISSINGKTVDQIKEDFKGLSTSVEGFLSIDVPKYKKLISDSEVRVDDRFGEFKDKVEENLDTIKADVNKEVTTALSEVESLNQNTINTVRKEFKETAKDLNKNVSNLVEEEFPKYKKFFAETELKTEETIKNAIDSYKETIESLNAKVKVFTETEIPKYNNLLIETKLKSEQEVKELEEEVLTKVNSLSEKVDFISGDVTEKTAEKIGELQAVIDEYKEEIDSISKTYQNLYKDFKKREISENEKLENYSKDIEKYYKRFNFLEETVHEDLREIQSVLVDSNETYHASLKTEVGKFRNNISEQMKGLEMDLVVNEQHIKKQNENIETVKEEIKEVLERLQLDTLEEKNKELVEKIAYLEETISEINKKKLLTEDNPTLPGDADTNNSADPLTPLNKKFATLDDLQNHYRLFINRIQQQIATIGGGGAGFIKDLDDVTFDVGIGTNKLLIYNGSKWVGIASTAVGGGSASELAENATGTNLTLSGNLNVTGDIVYDEANARNWNVSGIATATKVHVGVDTGFFSEDLVVNGDARVTGILTVGTGSITLDGDTDVISVGTGITITGSTGKIEATEIRTVGTTGAFYPPCLTTTQRDALSVTEGAMVFNKTTKKMEFYDGTSWIALPGMSLGLTVALDG